MEEIIHEKNIEGPIALLFTRSHKDNKNNNNYIMSSSLPKIKIHTDSRPEVKLSNPSNIKGVEIIDSSSDSEISVVSAKVRSKSLHPSMDKREPKIKVSKKSSFDPEKYQEFINKSKVKEESSDEYSSDDSSAAGSSVSSRSASSDASSNGRSKSKDKNDKREILLKLLNLEKKGVELSKKYNMGSKLSDLKFELEMHTRNAEVDISVKFQQKVLMAAVTGLEFANKNFNPLEFNLDGWSESVMDNLDDYESIFVKLYDKYKNKTDLPPEIQLVVALVGSAFMFHITKTIFSSSMPTGVDKQQTEEIMKNISRAMDKNNGPITGPSSLDKLFNNSSKINTDDQSSSTSVETYKEITFDNKGKKSITL